MVLPDHHYWLFRTKPQDDELFSSWLVRLAHGLACKLQTLTTVLLKQKSNFWIGDVDRAVSEKVLELLALKTVTPRERVCRTTLADYEGVLWERFHPNGPLPWLMPVVSVGRRRTGHGQQYCRLCLAEDVQPYFRRHWRLSCFVVCERHGILLRDACPNCGAAIEFHANDFGRRYLDEICGITLCKACGVDLRFPYQPDTPVDEECANFQRTIYLALQYGWSEKLPGAIIYSPLFFEGFRRLITLIATNGHGARLRNYLEVARGEAPTQTPFTNERHQFEELRLQDRLRVVKLVYPLLGNWPNNFIQTCRSSRVTSSYMLDYRKSTPYWFEFPIRMNLNDQDYAPTRQERKAARKYLINHGLSTCQNNINRWLGVACRREYNDPFAPTKAKWNPRNRIKRAN